MKFHAVMLDETGCEFGVAIKAQDKSWARQMLNEDYPESRCIQLESPQETKDREKAMYDSVNNDDDWNYEKEDYHEQY